jgi:2-polyprenyl-6-methoxyphenol hydroxylase-like FAD-dependent oxidoreductase
MVNEINPVPVAQTNGVSTDTNDLPPLVRQCEVCIVGAGIPGMICALLLKKQGVDVHVYERQGAVYPLPRAVVLADESIHVAVMAGLGHEMKNLIKSSKSASKDFVWVDAAEELLEQLDGRSPGSSGYPSLTLCNQPMIEAAIVLACEAADIPVFRHWEFEGYKKRTSPADPADREFEVFFRSYKGINRYNPTLNVQAKWLIGADGANSTVRKHAGISQTDFGLCYDWLIVDCVSLCLGRSLCIFMMLMSSLSVETG